MLKTVIPILLTAVIGGTIIMSISDNSQPFNLPAASTVMLLMLGIFAYSLNKTMKRQKVIYDSYRLTVENENLSRHQTGVAVVHLAFADITKIEEKKYGDLIIKGQPGQPFIAVSAFIKDYTELRNTLQAIQPITPQDNNNLFKKYPLIVTIITAGLMAAVYISDNKAIVGISGLTITTLMVWSFYKVRTSQQTDERVKRKAWWLLFLIASIIVIVYNKLVGI